MKWTGEDTNKSTDYTLTNPNKHASHFPTSKMTYRFGATLIKAPATSLTDMKNNTKTGRIHKRPQITKAILREKEKNQRLTIKYCTKL